MAMFHRCCRRKEAMAQFAFALLWQKFENAVMFADDDADSPKMRFPLEELLLQSVNAFSISFYHLSKLLRNFAGLI